MSTSSTFGAFMQAAETADATQTAEQQTETPATETTINEQTETPVIAEQAAPVEVPAEQTQEHDFSTVAINMDGGIVETATTQEPAQAAQAKPQDWRELIKSVDRKEVAKALGLSDFALELDEHVNRGGRADDYLNAKAVDYAKVSDVDLMKSDFAKKYPHLEPDERDYLFNKKYGITEFDDEDAQRDKRIGLKADAYEIRQQKIAEQAKFKIAEPKAATQNNEEAVRAQQAEELRVQQQFDFINQHPATQSLINSKRVTIDLGDGVSPFNVSVDNPTAITKLFSDGEEWHRATSTDKGEPNVVLMNQIALVAKTKGDIFKHIFNYGKSVGARKIMVDDGQNARRPIGTPPIKTSEAPQVTNKNSTFGQHGT